MTTPNRLDRDADLATIEAALRRDYAVKVETLEIEDWSTTLWTVEAPDSRLDELIEEARIAGGEQLRWEPYWALSWASCLDCAAVARTTSLDGKRVMDLGCGIGAVGAAAAAQGALVHLVDNAAPALRFAQRNTWPWRDQVTLAQLDWRGGQLDCQFEFIFGADVLYDRGQWDSLESFWRRHLAAGGQLVLGEPNRTMAASFPDWLEQRGWRVESVAAPHGRLISARLAGKR